MSSVEIQALVLCLCAHLSHGFLLDDYQKGNQVTVPPHDDYHDLVQLIVEEKTLRYRLESIVDNLSKHVSNLESAFTELARKCDSCSNATSPSGLANIESDIRVLKSQITSNNGTIGQLVNDLQVSGTGIAELKSNLTDMRNQVSGTNTTVDDIAQQLKIVNASIRSQDLANIESDVGMLKSQIASNNGTIGQLVNDLQVSGTGLAELKSNVADIRNQVSGTNTTIDDVVKKLQTVNASIPSQDLANIESDIRMLKSQIASNNGTIGQMVNDLQVSGTGLAELKSNVTDIRNQVSGTNTTIDDVLKKLQTVNASIPSQGTGYFFSVKTPTGNNGLFYDVNTNIGGSYDISNGVFVCRRPGVYIFTLNVGTLYEHSVYCVIRKNSKETVAAYTNTKDGTMDMASNTVFLKLAVNDTVTLQRCSNWNRANSVSSFSGGSIVLY